MFGMMKKLLNFTELSEYIGIPKRTLFNMIRDGRFPVEPVAGLKPDRWYIESIDAWLEGNK